MDRYLVGEDGFVPAVELGSEGLEVVSGGIRRRILSAVESGISEASGISDELGIDRQTAYYHLDRLEECGLLESEGSRPARYSVVEAAFYYRPDFVSETDRPPGITDIPEILNGFMEKGSIACGIVVGEPYLHGEYNRRHRFGYLAAELAAALGNYGRRDGEIIYTDGELDKEIRSKPLISVAGPLVNTLSAELEDELPAGFSDDYNAVKTEEKTYSGDNIGYVARSDVNGTPRILAAGIYALGTSAALEALSSRPEELGENGAVVKGTGTKRNVDDVDILEKL